MNLESPLLPKPYSSYLSRILYGLPLPRKISSFLPPEAPPLVDYQSPTTSFSASGPARRIYRGRSLRGRYGYSVTSHALEATREVLLLLCDGAMDG